MKKCCHCQIVKPLSEFFISQKTADKKWYWCKDCERLARNQSKEMKHSLSFSGGKDSTALLILLLEKKMPLDKIIYFDCEEFEFPEMRGHIEKVKSVLGVKIEECHAVKPFIQYIKEIGWASPHLRWCTNEKINSIRRALRFYRPCTQYIGYAADETMRINRANKKNEARKRDCFLKYSFPLVDMGITEKKALEICYAHGFDFGGLYEHWKRVSCWCCPLQNNKDLEKLKIVRPELYQKIIDMDKLAPDNYKFGSWKKEKAHVLCSECAPDTKEAQFTDNQQPQP
jgi:3'-phosphoadenosine 5'-phosphosulfate sulfotransferase (PAPS reductase)/FAD synthetase